MTTRDERDCGGLISIHNEFFFLAPPLPPSPPSPPFSPLSKSVIVLESWPDPRRAPCVSQNRRPGEEGGGRRRRRQVGLEGRQRGRGAAGRELLSSADYQRRSACANASPSKPVSRRAHTHTRTRASAMIHYYQGNDPSRLQSRAAQEQSI